MPAYKKVEVSVISAKWYTDYCSGGQGGRRMQKYNFMRDWIISQTVFDAYEDICIITSCTILTNKDINFHAFLLICHICYYIGNKGTYRTLLILVFLKVYT